MNYDELWPNGVRLIRSDDVFSLGTDAVMLSGFADKGGVKKALDIGCGSGIIAMMLAYNNPAITVDAVEIQEKASLIARENIQINGLDDKINVLNCDVRDYASMPPAGSYDLVISNPPYFPVNSGKESAKETAACAREERTLSLLELVSAASYFTKWGGKFALVHRPERLAEVCYALSSKKMEPKRLRFVHDKAGAPPCLILIESKRGANPGLKIEPPLIIRRGDGSFTDETLKIYHRKD